MLSSRLLNRIRPIRRCLCISRTFRKDEDNNKFENKSLLEDGKGLTKGSLGAMSSKYQIFRDQDSEEILDIYEERNKYAGLLEEEEMELVEEENPFQGISLERGITGVFDVDDLVEVLNRENAENVFVASVSKEIKYVDYICVVSAKSAKHMQAIAQFVRKVYKQRRHKTDLIPKLEGADSKDWMALDLGNIALHIFSREARTLYDLDSLWAVGPQYDREYNKKDPVAEMLEKHSIYLHDLQPAL